MNDGILGWKALTKYGFLLFLLGVFGPDSYFSGTLSYVWVVRAGELLFVAGLGTGAVLAATGRLPKGRGMRRRGGAAGVRGGSSHWFNSDDTGAGSAFVAAGAGAIAWMALNTDGTPMVEGAMVDVMGKSYGDSGSSFSNDIGGGIDSFSTDGSNLWD